ncbi:AEC family transporter [Catellatospora bangladeshensis]|uniref:Membrane protein n=1 Tax=Catellatospora bangladeshensis TaxID=310355 RepID=A0A8J3JGE4_9ACTN|nr:AEC family transporter [Catellatospora bangladeshensis]GIF84081.1 membrane protein [Catellatospora bangladeshensis]
MFAAFAPIWMITALGWGTMRFGVLTRATQQALANFTFLIAIPCVLFSSLVKVPLGELPLRPLAAVALSTLLIGLAVYFVARRLMPGPDGDRVIAAMAAAYLNAGNLGVPVALYVLKDVSLIMAVLVFQTILLTPLIVGRLDASAHRLGLLARPADGEAPPGDAGPSGDAGPPGEAGPRRDALPGRWRRLAMLPLRTPVILGSLGGVTASAAGWLPPEWLLRPLELLGGAAVPAALFALGMSLHQTDGRAWRLPGRDVAAAVLLKVVAQPLAAYLIGRYLLHLDGAALLAVTLVSGLPTAQNTFVYASEFRAATELSRNAILFSSLLSMGTLTLILWLLGPA